MDLPEKEFKSKHSSKKLSIMLFLLLFGMILGLAFFVYLKSQGIDFKSIDIKILVSSVFPKKTDNQAVAKEYGILYDINEHPAFCIYKEFIIKCTQDKVIFMDKKGETQWEFPVYINNPVIKAAGDYLLAADLGGKDIYVFSNKSILWSKKIENTIVNINIFENGCISIVQEIKGYKASIVIFDLNMADPLAFTRNIAEDFALSATVSPSGKLILINRIDTSGIVANTNLEFNSINSDQPFANILKEDVLLPSIWYLKNGFLLAVGDSLAICYDMDRNEKWAKEFVDEKILSSSICSDKYAVLAICREEKNELFNDVKTEIKVFNINGQQLSVYKIQDSVFNIQTYSDIIAVNTGNDVYFINTRGRLIKKFSSKTGIKEVYFFSKREAVIITRGGVMVVKVG